MRTSAPPSKRLYTDRPLASTSKCRLLISSGEPSGDLYGAELVRHLREGLPDLQAAGLGGDRLAAQGVELLAHVRELAVVGLWEVVSHLRRIHQIYRAVLDRVDRERPDLAVLIDYPDFNLRLAAALRQRGIPVVYYISPQIWAWRRGRLRSIRRDVSRMLVLFPFEEPIYREAGVPVTFVGHPLVDLFQPAPDRRAFLIESGLDPDRPVLALLPGSRPKEVAHNLPALVGAVRRLHARRPDLQFLAAIAPSLDPEQIRAPLRGLPVCARVGLAHGILSTATAAIVASGTATVEAALAGVPMVVVYRLSALTYGLGRPFMRVPHFAMVNLIAGRKIVAELIQAEFTPERVETEVLALLDPERSATLRADLREVRSRLGDPGASARAAREVAGLFRTVRDRAGI